MSETKSASISSQATVKKKTNTSINYNQSISCEYKTKEASISAAIEGSSLEGIFITNNTTQKYVVQGDCLYSWILNELKGTKKCGVGNYISMGKQLLSSGLGTVESLTSMIPQSEKTVGINFKEVFASCKNVNGIEKGVFAIPSKIKFGE